MTLTRHCSGGEKLRIMTNNKLVKRESKLTNDMEKKCTIGPAHRRHLTARHHHPTAHRRYPVLSSSRN